MIIVWEGNGQVRKDVSLRHLANGTAQSASCFVVAVAVLAIVTAACTPTAAPTPGTEPTASPGTAPLPKAGGTLTIDTAEPIRNVDPAKFQNTQEIVSVAKIAETLLRRGPDMQLEPQLATSWRVEPDGVTWTFNLRKGVKFSDGTPFNAQAVVANFERWHDPKNTGINTRIFRAELISAEIVDDYTVRFKTPGSQPHTAAILAAWGTNIISPTQLARVGRFGSEIDAAIIGTGPFKVESFISGEKLTLVRNDEYWGEKALLERVVLLAVADPSARTAALLAGQIDLAIRFPSTQVPVVRARQGVTIVEFPALIQSWFEFNVRHPPLDKPQVRTAIIHAIDMEAVKRVVFEGFAAPFQGPINPTVFRPDPPVQGIAYDPQRARALLQQAGVSDLRLKFVFHEATPLRYAELLQAQLREVGVALELVRVDRPASDAARTSGAFDISSNLHGNSILVPAVILSGTLHSRGSTAAVTGYKNPAIDRLIDEALVQLDEKKRSSLLTEVFREYVKDPQGFAHVAGVSVVAHRSRVKGFVAYPNGYLPLTQMWLDD